MVIWRISDEVSARWRKTQDKDTEKTLGTGSTSRNIWMIFISDRRMQYIFIAQIFFLFISPYKTLFPQYITSCPSLHSQLQEPLIRAKFISIAGQQRLKIASVTGEEWQQVTSRNRAQRSSEQMLYYLKVLCRDGETESEVATAHNTAQDLVFPRAQCTAFLLQKWPDFRGRQEPADKSFRMEPSRPWLYLLSFAILMFGTPGGWVEGGGWVFIMAKVGVCLGGRHVANAGLSGARWADVC